MKGLLKNQNKKIKNLKKRYCHGNKQCEVQKNNPFIINRIVKIKISIQEMILI